MSPDDEGDTRDAEAENGTHNLFDSTEDYAKFSALSTVGLLVGRIHPRIGRMGWRPPDPGSGLKSAPIRRMAIRRIGIKSADGSDGP